MNFFIQDLHLNFHSFLGFQHGSGSSVKAIMRLSATLPLAIGLKCFWFLIALLLYPKSTILGLSFLDPKDLCLPNQFSKAFCQYIPNLMSKKKERLIIDRSKWCQYWFSLKFKRLAILIVHDVKNQSINEQK